MKILQVSNIVSHHQLPLSRELLKIVGEGNFVFAAMQGTDKYREKLGWNVSSDDEWIINPSVNPTDMEIFERCWSEFDVVICGERFFDKMLERVKDNKLCFYMSERWWKPPVGKLRLLSPSFLKMTLQLRELSKSRYFHYLPIGPYAALDMGFICGNKLAMWDWGYFTSLNSNICNKSRLLGPLRVLWAGRMIACKRVGMIVKAVSVLQKNGVDIELNLIGDGPEANKVRRMADKLLKKNTYSIQGAISADKVPCIMAEHNVYVLSSSEYEGWGAVINEAMSVGCAVVSSNGAGAAVSMIDNYVDGILFRQNEVKELINAILTLSSDRILCRNIGIQARKKVEELWSPSLAAKRLVQVSTDIHTNKAITYYESGPMSNKYARK